MQDRRGGRGNMAERQYRALQPITRLVRGVLIALSAVEVVYAVLLFLQYRLVSAVNHGDMSVLGSIRDNAKPLVIVAGVHTLVLLTMLVMFFRWIYRAMHNVHAFGAGDEVYSPALSVGGFFIPFANFVMPCIAMSQIWRASVSAGLWRDQPTSPLVGVWWALWLGISLFSFVLFFMSPAASKSFAAPQNL